MENNQRFIKIIQSAGIELYEELKNGNILAVNLYDNDMSWEIKLQFNNILPLNMVLFLHFE